MGAMEAARRLCAAVYLWERVAFANWRRPYLHSLGGYIEHERHGARKVSRSSRWEPELPSSWKPELACARRFSFCVITRMWWCFVTGRSILTARIYTKSLSLTCSTNVG